MMLSLPSFFAAVTRADMPPTSAADFAVAAFTVEVVPPPPQAVSRTRAPARRPSRFIAASHFIAFPPRAGRRWPGTCAADKRMPCSPPFFNWADPFPPFKPSTEPDVKERQRAPPPQRHGKGQKRGQWTGHCPLRSLDY